jgi:hypothetical protein
MDGSGPVRNKKKMNERDEPGNGKRRQRGRGKPQPQSPHGCKYTGRACPSGQRPRGPWFRPDPLLLCSAEEDSAARRGNELRTTGPLATGAPRRTNIQRSPFLSSPLLSAALVFLSCGAQSRAEQSREDRREGKKQTDSAAPRRTQPHAHGRREQTTGRKGTGRGTCMERCMCARRRGQWCGAAVLAWSLQIGPFQSGSTAPPREQGEETQRELRSESGTRQEK